MCHASLVCHRERLAAQKAPNISSQWSSKSDARLHRSPSRGAQGPPVAAAAAASLVSAFLAAVAPASVAPISRWSPLPTTTYANTSPSSAANNLWGSIAAEAEVCGRVRPSVFGATGVCVCRAVWACVRLSHARHVGMTYTMVYRPDGKGSSAAVVVVVDVVGTAPAAPRAILKEPNFFFLLRTALEDRPQRLRTANHQPPPRANRHQPPTATNCQPPPSASGDQPPSANHCQPPPTTNHQPPTAANRQQPPPTANGQPPTANCHQPWLNI